MTRKPRKPVVKRDRRADTRLAEEAPMRLRRLKIGGMRTLADVTLDLGGLTVLIGDNGSGKSSILEACEILRRAASANDFLTQFNNCHGGVSEIRRFGQADVTIQVEVDWQYQSVVYLLGLGDVGIERELLKVGGAVHLDRQRQRAFVFPDQEPRASDSGRTLLLAQAERGDDGIIRRLVDLLASCEIHLPFDVLPRWVAREKQRPAPMRESRTIAPAARLQRLGDNLANAYASLKERPRTHWEETMEWVRLGLGHDVENVSTAAQPGAGAIALALRYKSGQEVPAYALSDGMLAYLAFVAVFRLNGGNGLLAFDEPESHLHPSLLARVVDFMESAAENRPVLVATQSDALVDHLQDPAGSVVLCDLDERGATRLVRPDRPALTRWLERYRGLGDIRAAGHQRSVMQQPLLPKLRLSRTAHRRRG